MHWKHFITTGSRAGFYFAALGAVSSLSGFSYQTYRQWSAPVAIQWNAFSFLSLSQVHWGGRQADSQNGFAGFQARLEESRDAAALSSATFKTGSHRSLVASVGKVRIKHVDTIQTIQAAPIETFKPIQTEDQRLQNIHLNIRSSFLAALGQSNEYPSMVASSEPAISISKSSSPASGLPLIEPPRSKGVLSVAKTKPLSIAVPISPPSGRASDPASESPAAPTADVPALESATVNQTVEQIKVEKQTPSKSALVTIPKSDVLLSTQAAKLVTQETHTQDAHVLVQRPVPPPLKIEFKKKWDLAQNQIPLKPSLPSQPVTPVISPPPVDPDKLTPPPGPKETDKTLPPSPDSEYPFEAGIQGNPRVDDFHVEAMAAESTQTGWFWMKTSRFWPTLYRRAAGLQKSIPVFSRNSLSLLAKTAGASLLDRTAQLYIRIPKGWRVEISSRNDGQILWNRQEKVVNEADPTAEAAMIFNIEPGQALVYLRSNEVSVAVHSAFLSGGLTYLDASTLRTVEMSLQVLDATQTTELPLAGASVQIVGQPNEKQITSKKGWVEFKNLHYLQGYPLHVDVQKSSTDIQQPVNRFEINSAPKQQIFYFDQEALGFWTHQLEGGAYANGHVIASLKDISDRLAWAKVGSVTDPQHSTAESYSMDARGFLRVGNPLDVSFPRLFASELADDIYRIEVSDESKAVIWSKLLFASPGVLCVVHSQK